jgi:hypothetical protein
MAGGGAPDTALAVLLTMLVAWAGTSIADRGFSPLAILGTLGISQAGMHLLLNYVVPTHIGHGVPPVDPRAMVVTHVIATVLTALLLAKADVAVLLVTSAMRLLFSMPHVRGPLVVAAVEYVLPTSPRQADRLLEVLFRRVCARRGPPVRS